VSYTGSPLLIEAIKRNNILECIRLIEEAYKHQRDRHGWSPIIWASSSGYFDIVELLLSKGANIHDKDNKHGYSPIIMASARNDDKMVDLLLSKGASLQDTDIFGSTPIYFARESELNPNPYRKHGVLYHLHKWPTTMAIIMLMELALYHKVETDSLIDLHHFLGIPDEEGDSYILDSEEIYTPA
jgi:hypothetical protein